MLFSIDGHFVTKRLSSAFFEILSSKHIGVTSLTFQDHVTSSITYTIRFHIGHFLKRGLLEPSLSNQWSNYEGARGGLTPLKDRVAPSKHLVWEGTRGLLKGPLKSPVKFNTWLQDYMIALIINIILCTDGDAPSPATWFINHAQFLIRRNQRCRLKL